MAGDDVFPDRDMSHRDKVAFMIEREGWAMDAVPTNAATDPPLPPYSYTIGLQDRFGFPEVCLFGLAPVACRGLFGLVVDALAGGTEFPVGAGFIGLLDGGQPSAFLTVDGAAAAGMFPALTDHREAMNQDPTGFAMVQLAWPDRNGNLPWEAGFAEHLLPVQLLLGEPPS